MKTFDAVIIGAGQSGPFLAARMAQAGRRVALIERRGLGGTCVNDGCIPTKALVASARAAWVARNAARFGVMLSGDITVDMKRVKARKDTVVQESRDSLKNWLHNTENLTVIYGHARFESATTVRVGDELLEAAQFFINVGGRALIPDALQSVPVLTNHSMMDVDYLPEHLIVVGGSYVGLEFAQMYRRFGSRVTVIEQGPRLIAREDDDVCEEVLRIVRDEGIEVHLATTVQTATGTHGAITLQTSGPVVTGSHVLAAVGRLPNTHDLGLDRAGVAVDARGFIPVDDTLHTNVPHIFALGDANGRGAFTHTSYNDFEIVAENLLDGAQRRVSDRLPIYGLFIDPPLGRVGMNEREARASGRKVLMGKRMMTRVGRARERGETYGFIKVLVEAETKSILGAAILGVEGDEAIHCIADVMYARAPYTVLSQAVHAHPTVSELIPTTFQSLVPLV